MTTSSLNIKQVPVWVVNIRVQMLCFSYIAYPLPVIVRKICLFDNFEKLSTLLGFSRYILEGWARGCCVHVFLVPFEFVTMVGMFITSHGITFLFTLVQVKVIINHIPS